MKAKSRSKAAASPDRLGWLPSARILMLEHTGRVSGRARFECLEVVEQATGRPVVTLPMVELTRT